ncbi:OLC1v1036058C1 [Oldenlandia corymbosa var. corymbosa]|uniref:OLC1v1036058C1 n=1 Tax=Oldenlandia corymbosa var. corymbosa TaxID=529605 RepID=A0AAV1CWC2_OLDCO|nr:OLC1v1036058C1 [Oldenlandia corymbosa var. corymbosa]
MVNITYSYDAPSSIAPARLFKSLILDDNFLPKAVPQAFKSVEKVSGDGGVGSIYHITFGEG